MDVPRFTDEDSLSNTAEEFGKQAMKMGLIPSFVVRHFPDSKQFYIPNENQSEPLTPEQAYMILKRMVSDRT